MAFIELNDICKDYGTKETKITALNHISFTLEKNELVVILGASGAGKSTLLNILGGMDFATSGSYRVNGREITTLNEKEMALFRRNNVGFVFQFYNLMPNLTALENVMLSSNHVSNSINPQTALEMVGLKDRINNFPSNLSGGEQQRVSIARAIAKKPEILLCDEPTGALDSNTSRDILVLLEQINQKYGTTMLIVTHNNSIKNMVHQVIRIKDGMIRECYENETRVPAAELEDL